MMRKNIKNILREFVENRIENGDFEEKVDYMQKKVKEKSKYPQATEKVNYMKDKIKKDVKNILFSSWGLSFFRNNFI